MRMDENGKAYRESGQTPSQVKGNQTFDIPDISRHTNILKTMFYSGQN